MFVFCTSLNVMIITLVQHTQNKVAETSGAPAPLDKRPDTRSKGAVKYRCLTNCTILALR